jgi:FAD/FMN-containing dehydrogenase
MVIDLSAMRGVFVEPDAQTVRVQGGALHGWVDRAENAFARHLAAIMTGLRN